MNVKKNSAEKFADFLSKNPTIGQSLDFEQPINPDQLPFGSPMVAQVWIGHMVRFLKWECQCFGSFGHGNGGVTECSSS